MNPDFQRELLAYDEKTALAELEEAKASERVAELKYQKARFCLDAFCMSLKEQQKNQATNIKPEKDSIEGTKNAG
jgi:hypothetical protein